MTADAPLNISDIFITLDNRIDGHGEVVDAVGNDVWRRATRYILQERQTWDLVKVVTVLQFQPLRYNNVSHVDQKKLEIYIYLPNSGRNGSMKK